MIAKFTPKRLLVASCLSLASLSSDAQSYLPLNGGTQYVDCTNSTILNATSIRTLECWVKFNNLSVTQAILSRSASGAGIELVVYNNELNLFCMQTTSNASYVHTPFTGMTTGVWYHIAGTWDGSTKESMRLYVNGVSVGTRSDFGDINVTGIANPAVPFYIGRWSETSNPRYFNGSVDEARVWSVVRTATELKNGMYTVPPASAGLLAYYKLDDAAGATAANWATTGGSINGTLVGSPAWTNSPVQNTSNGLNFDGSNDQVGLPVNTAFDLTAGGTLEMWVQPSNLSASPVTLLGNRGTGGIRYALDMTTTDLGFRNNTTRVAVANTFTNGTWYHVAAVYSGTDVTFYVNGTLVGTPQPITITTGTTGQPVTLGIAKSASPDAGAFGGNMDEVRIWNTQRTATEINNSKNNTSSGTATGLVAAYNFNQGGSNTDNAGMSIATDRTANNFHATLTNFALTGTTSNWVSTTALALPVDLTYFTASKDGDKVVLQWETAQEQNSRDFIIERSADGVSFTTIGTLPAAGNSGVKIAYSFTDFAPEAGTNYYRLVQTDLNGQSKTYKTVSVKFPLIAGVKIAPNPAVGGTVNYTVNGLRKSQALVSVTDMMGKKLLIRNVTLQAGVNRLSLDVSALSAGNYTLQVIDAADGQQTSQRLVIVK